MIAGSWETQYEQQESLKLFNRARPSPTHSGIWKETLVRPSALTSTTRALKLLLWLLPLNTQCKICVISLHFNAQNHDKNKKLHFNELKADGIMAVKLGHKTGIWSGFFPS